MKIEIPQFATRKELFKWLVENKNHLIAQKKFSMKKADGIPFINLTTQDGKIDKAADAKDEDPNVIYKRPVINTTNIIDSHLDLHIPGLWDKSLKENGKNMVHLQEHEMKFDHIISDESDLKAYTQTFTWKELGLAYKGNTQALVFDSTIRKDRNPYMFDQYSKGRVKNHSVGMWYVKLVMCINDEDYGAEFEAWEKYLPQAVNPEVAESTGYFWAVTEAKAVEGSAVVKGSNFATPTLDMKSEPGNHSETHIPVEPRKHSLDISKLLSHYKI
jgi:hypothetical protein